ncbi:hypothetical protein PHYSODRAFT_336545 [Phytophthora sojae]|uniref:Uncharacterized protein n=1 Tax=Phytophthora sojae (strain P6497) TaxID=1094619 RepID=G4ZYP5_PHYSP|nr:hypothetical protein PHYSODRAFT_336545 [Phytophthora sojae]EGZ12078.1 hypothetical protein PHYSODRAFT_336545 [Phytophthora sojae]|eukprot:XP_009532411.1 hypothetical protein PHYSODRAFT_336545 [Phytophthora sojae]
MPSIVEKLIDKALAGQKKSGQTGMPLSQIDITGCEDCTLVSSVFVSEIPHPSLERVFAAAMAHFDSIPAWMKHHFAIEARVKRLNSDDSPEAYSQLTPWVPGFRHRNT